MELRNLSKEELMEYLVNGIQMPETSMLNKKTISFYFEELENFINLAENDFYARIINKSEITVAFGDIDFIVMRRFIDKMLFYMAPEVADDIENMSPSDASNVVGLVYGVIVYNAKWEEVSALASQISPNDNILQTAGSPIKINSIDMENLKDFVKKNKKYMSYEPK